MEFFLEFYMFYDSCNLRLNEKSYIMKTGKNGEYIGHNFGEFNYSNKTNANKGQPNASRCFKDTTI